MSSEFIIEEYFKITGTYELVDGLVNVTGDVRLIKLVDVLPCKFGIVTGDFNCSINKLTSLSGVPKEVGGSFNCSINNLTNLTGSPKIVGGPFNCSYNNLTNLTGSPKIVGGSFVCDKHLHSTEEYKRYLILKKLRT